MVEEFYSVQTVILDLGTGTMDDASQLEVPSVSSETGSFMLARLLINGKVKQILATSRMASVSDSFLTLDFLVLVLLSSGWF